MIGECKRESSVNVMIDGRIVLASLKSTVPCHRDDVLHPIKVQSNPTITDLKGLKISSIIDELLLLTIFKIIESSFVG